MTQLVWLVTGCSSGFGAQFIKTIIRRGDLAIATARNTDTLREAAELGAKTLQLDVTASPSELDAKVKEAIAFYGRVNVLVQNAGYCQLGPVELVSYAKAIHTPPLEPWLIETGTQRRLLNSKRTHLLFSNSSNPSYRTGAISRAGIMS